MGGGTPKFGVDIEGGEHNQGDLGACSPRFFFFLIDALILILRHSGGTSSQF